MTIREYKATDRDTLVALFTESVHQLAVGYYDADQRAVWAPRPANPVHWQRVFEKLFTLVAEQDGNITGFIAFEPDGHIALLFVSPEYQGKGVAFHLYREVESRLANQGTRELFTEASLVARPFFERQGFVVEEKQRVMRKGIELVRFAMRKARDAS